MIIWLNPNITIVKSKNAIGIFINIEVKYWRISNTNEYKYNEAISEKF